jgi:hypothetical protein
MAKQQTVWPLSGAITRIMMGVFGAGTPLSADQMVGGTQGPTASWFEGDLFTPGTGNYVFEPRTENPVQTIWGRSFPRRTTAFPPLQSPQLYANPNVFTNGIGGLQAGTMELEPLLFEGS